MLLKSKTRPDGGENSWSQAEIDKLKELLKEHGRDYQVLAQQLGDKKNSDVVGRKVWYMKK